MRRNAIFLLSILLLVFFGLVACADDDTADTEKEEEKIFDPEPNAEAAQISSYNQERMDEQADMDADILAEYKNVRNTVFVAHVEHLSFRNDKTLCTIGLQPFLMLCERGLFLCLNTFYSPVTPPRIYSSIKVLNNDATRSRDAFVTCT